MTTRDALRLAVEWLRALYQCGSDRTRDEMRGLMPAADFCLDELAQASEGFLGQEQKSFGIGLQCPRCQVVTEVADGSAIPMGCDHCGERWGPGCYPRLRTFTEQMDWLKAGREEGELR